jgi:tetratricopeptide (TPR) repeat protein
MARLDPSDTLHLEAAQGWLGFNDWREANEELDRITPAMRTHPSVLRARILVCIAAEKWDLMHQIAQTMLVKLPYDASICIYAGMALDRLNRTSEAYDLLASYLKRFPKDAKLNYDLACYACKLGSLEQAMGSLERAIDVSEKDIRQQALHDLALEPIWANISKI